MTAETMMLEGTLNEFGLADLFQLLSSTRKSGVLRLTSERREGAVAFRGGLIAGAVADVGRAELPLRLASAGLVADEDLDRIRPERDDLTGTVLAAALAEAGIVERSALEAVLRDQVHDAAFDLVRLEEGRFAFQSTADAGTPVLLLAPEDVAAETGRRLARWEDIRAHLPSVELVPSLASRPGGAEPLTLTLEEWGLLVLLDGRRRIEDVVELSGQGEYATCTILARLVESGFVEVAPSADQGTVARALARSERLRQRLQVDAGRGGVVDAPAQRTAFLMSEPPVTAAAPDEPVMPVLDTEVPETAYPVADELASASELSTALEVLATPVVDAPVASAPVAEETVAEAPFAEEPAASLLAPASSVAADPSAVDRFQAARELASLGLEDGPVVPPSVPSTPVTPAEPVSSPVVEGDAEPGSPAAPRSEEDPNKHLLLRLIDGVKGA